MISLCYNAFDTVRKSIIATFCVVISKNLLAILLRDHGQRAFEALIIKTEHAQFKGMEHAQGVNGMKVTLNSLYPMGIRNVVFESHAVTTDHLTIVFLGSGKPRKIKFLEEIDHLKLDADQTRTLVRRIVNAMLAQWATPKVNQPTGGYMWCSAMLAVRTYLADDREFYRKVLAATIVYHGGCAKDPVALLRAVIPQEEIAKIEQTEKDKNRMSGMMPDKSLQLVIDHSLKYFSPEELSDLWRKMLEMRFREGYHTSYIMEWNGNIKIADKYIEANDVRRQCLIRDLRKLSKEHSYDPTRSQIEFTDEHMMWQLESLATHSWEWLQTTEGKECFDGLIVECMATGQVAKAAAFLARLSDFSNRCSSAYFSCEKEKFDEPFFRLMHRAVDLAVEVHSFGVATALAEYLGETERADELRKYARLYGQKVALDPIFITRSSCGCG